MGKSYKIVINSANGQNQITGTSSNVLGTLSNSVYFPFVNWSQMLPEGKYKLTWTYTGSGNMLRANKPAKIRINGLIVNNCYEPNSNGGVSTNIDLGYLKCGGLKLYSTNNTNNNVGFLYASLNDNPAIILNSRPHNGPITIEILDQNNNLWYDDTGRIVQATADLVGSTTNVAGNTIIRNMPAAMRVFIGTPLWWHTANPPSKYTKLINFNASGRGAPTTYNTYTGTTAFATGGITYRIDPSNPPGHYILQLNFELLE